MSSWSERMAIKEGDTVRYNREALDRIFTAEPIRVSPMGVVTGIQEESGMKFAEIDWGEPNLPDLVNVLNLRKARSRGIE